MFLIKKEASVRKEFRKHQYDTTKGGSACAILIESRQIFLRPLNDLITEKSCSLVSVTDNRVYKSGKSYP